MVTYFCLNKATKRTLHYQTTLWNMTS